MPVDAALKIDNLPTEGWSSSWGLEGMPRPGCMTGVYWLQTTGATGFAVNLNKGMFLFYNGVGSVAGVSYPAQRVLPFSFEFVRLNWTSAFGDPTKVVFDLTLAAWLEGGLPCEWGKTYAAAAFPTSREPFNLSPPGASPCPSFPATIPNDVTITPLTDYAVTIWRSL